MQSGILSIVVSICDPSQFLAPFVLMGKRMLQEMCQKDKGWDEPLSCVLKPRWENWVNDLRNLQLIPRCFTPENFGIVLKTLWLLRSRANIFELVHKIQIPMRERSS